MPPPYGLPRLRVSCSGGTSLPVEVRRGFGRGFSCIVLEGYGGSEASPTAAFTHMERERKPGLIGTPIKSVDMRVAAVVWLVHELPKGPPGKLFKQEITAPDHIAAA